jgi:hypothetical protein
MNIKYSYYVHKYYSGGSHGLHVSHCTISVYQNGFFNMDIKLYNKLPENNKKITLNNFKKELKSLLLQNSFYVVEECIQTAL